MTKVIETCAAVAIAGLPDDIVQRFATDPLGTLRNDLKLIVRSVDHLVESRTDGGVCDGISFLNDGVVLYRRTGNRRENFTLAHELGHWLVDQTDEIYDTVAGLDDAGRILESVCDRIARRLLLPDRLLSTVVGSGVVEAKHVGDLHEATKASIHACTIALADMLPSLGAVVVIRRGEREILYASIQPDAAQGWPKVYPWTGQPIPAAHPLRNIRPGGTLRQRTFWSMAWGERADFYVDAVADSSRTFAILSAEDLWRAERFHPATHREFDQRPLLQVSCCSRAHEVRGWPCESCGEGFCPTCGNCRCQNQLASEVLCTGSCFMQYLPHLLVDGHCEDCR